MTRTEISMQIWTRTEASMQIWTLIVVVQI